MTVIISPKNLTIKSHLQSLPSLKRQLKMDSDFETFGSQNSKSRLDGKFFLKLYLEIYLEADSGHTMDDDAI